MKAKHRRTLEAIFSTPTRTIVFSDIEILIRALGGEVREGERWGKEAKKYQVEELREWFDKLEVKS